MRSPATLLLAVSLAACGPAVQGRAHSDLSSFPSQRLTAAEFTPTHQHRDLLSVVRQLRPQYLNRYGVGGAPGQVTYVDGVRTGDVSVLQSIRTSDVAEVRFLSGIDATTRYGHGHSSGAILITTRSGLRR